MKNYLANLKPIHYILAIVNVALLLGFGSLFLGRLNYEFVIYVLVILFLLCLVAVTFPGLRYSTTTLIGLTVWSGMHLAGGGISWGDGRLYDVILFPLSNQLPIWRYDQLVHMWGFGTCTLLAYDLVRPALQPTIAHPIALSIVLAMAGLGFGALNEIVEFLVTLIVPSSGVGGYENTALDLCSNLIGATLAVGLLWWRRQANTSSGA